MRSAINFIVPAIMKIYLKPHSAFFILQLTQGIPCDRIMKTLSSTGSLVDVKQKILACWLEIYATSCFIRRLMCICFLSLFSRKIIFSFSQWVEKELHEVLTRNVLNGRMRFTFLPCYLKYRKSFSGEVFSGRVCNI